MYHAWPGGIGPLPGGMTNYCPSVLDTVGWVTWPVKIVPDMTYNVFGGTLNPTLLLLNHWPTLPCSYAVKATNSTTLTWHWGHILPSDSCWWLTTNYKRSGPKQEWSFCCNLNMTKKMKLRPDVNTTGVRCHNIVLPQNNLETFLIFLVLVLVLWIYSKQDVNDTRSLALNTLSSIHLCLAGYLLRQIVHHK